MANNLNAVGAGGSNGQFLGWSGSNCSWMAPTYVSQTWNTVTTNTALVKSNSYFVNASGVTFTLPATAAVGDSFTIKGLNVSGWAIAQGTGQSIGMGQFTTTVGTGGSLTSILIGDGITIVCSIANTGFQVIASVGNIALI